MPQFVVMFALRLTEYHFKILGDEKRVFYCSAIYISVKKRCTYYRCTLLFSDTQLNDS